MNEQTTHRWREAELVFQLPEGGRPYLDVAFDVVFEHEGGRVLRRPAFWDGGGRWVARFASPEPDGVWRWRVQAEPSLPISPVRGALRVEPAEPRGLFERHGLLRMSDDGRSVVHADGRSFLVVADTPWAVPWRATLEQVDDYAADRAARGFNAALLMSVQPDMRAVGPRDRSQDEGFEVGFEDLPQGRLTQLVPDYFQKLDALMARLRSHGVVPVFQPVFHGFGWKGLCAAGQVVPPDDYARYCRYLVARYGAGPAIWLVGGDGSGREPNIEAGGRAVHACDAYEQPTGIHYGPHWQPNAHQDADWLDFQWCQTGHAGEHLPERVMWLWHQRPAKACANGEPSYERLDRAAGWWQGHEAWSNLCSGGTMGVVYGAMSLWPWRRHPDEPGNAEIFTIPGYGWREAMALPGSAFVGNVGRILRGYDLTGLTPDWSQTLGRRSLIRPNELCIVYLPDGGRERWMGNRSPERYRVFDAKTAALVREGTLTQPDGSTASHVETPPGPHVVIFADAHPAAD